MIYQRAEGLSPFLSAKSIALLFMVLLLCVKIFSAAQSSYAFDTAVYSSAEEFKADWEKDADSILMGEAVLNDFRKSGNEILKMNALCSLQSMIELDRVRFKLLSIIETAVSSACATDEGLLAAVILERTAAADIKGLSSLEKQFIKVMKSLPLKNKNFKTGNFADGTAPWEMITLLIQCLAINSSGGSFSFTNESFYKKINCYPALKINPGKSFETAHVDYYRLFLYMRDDTKDSLCNEITYSFPPCFNQLFNSLISFIQIRKQHQATFLQKEGGLFPTLTHSLLFLVCTGAENFITGISFCGEGYSLRNYHFEHNHHGGLL